MTDKKDVIVLDTPNKLVGSLMPAIKRGLPKHLSDNADRYARIIITEFNKNPKLWRCTHPSLMGSIMQSTQLGLEMGGVLGQCFMVPYNNMVNGQKVLEAQFQIGYKGYVILLNNSGKVSGVRAKVVWGNSFEDKERFEHEEGLNEKLIHVPDPKYWGKAIQASYAIITYKDGYKEFLVMYKEELDKIAGKSKSDARKYWPEEMCRKDPVRRICKTAPLSPEDKRLLHQDETTKYYHIGQDPQMVLDAPDQTDWKDSNKYESIPDLSTQGGSSGSGEDKKENQSEDTGNKKSSDTGEPDNIPDYDVETEQKTEPKKKKKPPSEAQIEKFINALIEKVGSPQVAYNKIAECLDGNIKTPNDFVSTAQMTKYAHALGIGDFWEKGK